LPTLVMALSVPVEVPLVAEKPTVRPELIGLLFRSLMVAVSETVFPDTTVADETVIEEVAG
jgi:hypothetical protein